MPSCLKHRILLAIFLATAPTLPAQRHTTHPTHNTHWVETRLYFGLGRLDTPATTTEANWQNFLDTEVTPRFPAGLSVADLYGQWQTQPTDPIQRLRSKVLILDYPATPANAARIEAIRTAWKRRTGDLSVLRVTQPADVSF